MMTRILDKVKLRKLRRERYLARVEQTPPLPLTPEREKKLALHSVEYRAVPAGSGRKAHRARIAVAQELARKARHAARTSPEHASFKARWRLIRKAQRQLKFDVRKLGESDGQELYAQRMMKALQ